ncbi:hypothetical protein QTP81_14710 [Alteromonas sp. ASW11-36]|uniref:Uncharacterized protein n=1 Tax=Alteromonas arenosi TaxID=3055817 RepID=A0ABT7T087_9ALTE|nr:hypothetical protein [Alteromonas sp. ASW11-36]MDM7861852.1 hypothetical protein [Alteromonas sp. ASW11-36]
MADTDAQTLNWDTTTLCPIEIPFGLQLGFRHDAELVRTFIETLPDVDSAVEITANSNTRATNVFAGSDYVDTTNDASTLRLFTWRKEFDSATVIFHVFPLHLAIGEIRLRGVSATNATLLDEQILTHSETVLLTAYESFIAFLNKAENLCGNASTQFDTATSKPKIYWPSRTLMLDQSALSETGRAEVIEDWLKDTHRPQDAKKINEGLLKESMTWLKYVVIAPQPQDYRIETMVLAQYCYTAQEKCNQELRQAIEWAFSGDKRKLENEVQRAKRALEKSRVMAKLHGVSVNESLRHLTRVKRRLIQDIFACWEYDRLVQNGQSMLDLCTDKIQESNSRQAKISAYKTEYILMGISLFTVLEFFFFVTQFSREAMANPTLDHNDGGPSSFLTLIADFPADLMFLSGVLFAAIIFWFYWRAKG